MTKYLRSRFWVESALAIASALLLLLTLVWRDWIERVSPFEPDGGDGSMEWALVAVCLLATVSMSFLARGEWLRARRLVTS